MAWLAASPPPAPPAAFFLHPARSSSVQATAAGWTEPVDVRAASVARLAALNARPSSAPASRADA
eukprot:446910-Pleurochrysis_carterae.AAC.1